MRRARQMNRARRSIRAGNGQARTCIFFAAETWFKNGKNESNISKITRTKKKNKKTKMSRTQNHTNGPPRMVLLEFAKQLCKCGRIVCYIEDHAHGMWCRCVAWLPLLILSGSDRQVLEAARRHNAKRASDALIRNAGRAREEPQSSLGHLRAEREREIKS